MVCDVGLMGCVGRRTTSIRDYDLTAILRRCSSGTVPITAKLVKDVKVFPRCEYRPAFCRTKLTPNIADRDALLVVQRVVSKVKSSVKSRLDKSKQKILESELYLEWLQELEFVVTAIEVGSTNPKSVFTF